MYAVAGEILWDGKTRPESVRAVFVPGLGGLHAARTYSHMKDSWHIDEMLMSRHGLYYGIFYAEAGSEGLQFNEIRIEDEGGRLEKKEKAETGRSLIEFFGENVSYLTEFGQDMARNMPW
jgi:hypothetical protein